MKLSDAQVQLNTAAHPLRIELRYGLRGLMSYIAENITLARPRCSQVWGFILLS